MQQGDYDAAQEIYARYNDQIYRTVYFLARNKSEVEDIVSEVYMAMFQALRAYDFGKPFKPWLNGIIVRQTSNWKRRMWRGFRLQAKVRERDIVRSPRQPEEQVLESEKQYELLAQVDKLSMKHREVIVLRYYQDCSFEEIGDCLGIPVGTVKSRHHHAIRRLQSLLGNFSMDREGTAHVH
jgi:RNA polymerase sigma factor, sigma-70 family